ncbi:MAG TPA: bifunctional enoyl-CoA hydratase/phosphate acetyltransferase [Alphaproteobacteria bacterium]|nr:bifunctional enoyl-CoA hydratase/phosphate acetyltransferase [Alphaproteobacteria bacterium]
MVKKCVGCFDKAIESCSEHQALRTAVVHPVRAVDIETVSEATNRGLIDPVLVGPAARIQSAAEEAGIDISSFQIVSTEHSHEAAQVSAKMAASGEVNALMKGGLHSDEILHAVIVTRSLMTERRLSHAYLMDIPTYHKPLVITDAAVNISPDLDIKADICQNAIYFWRALFGGNQKPKVALLAAVETVNGKMQATIDAACLCKMAERGQILDGIIDGPLAFDNAISVEAAKSKGIVSEVAGDPDILIPPNLESCNILAKQLTFLGNAKAAGIILGARVPIILTSRADSIETRLMSCALAVKVAAARTRGAFK